MTSDNDPCVVKASCPKCGGDTTITYCRGGSEDREGMVTYPLLQCRQVIPHKFDRFHRTCMACEYFWLDEKTLPLDAR